MEYPNYVLLRRLREVVWVFATPERDVQIEDPSTFNLLPLTRGGAIPRLAAVTHRFAKPIDAELEGLHAQAARLAALMGLVAGVAVAAPTIRWRIADSSAAEFGREVATDLVLSPVTGVARGSVGLVRSGEPPPWLFYEHVPNAELVAWEADKHAGAGRDRRLGAPPA